MKKEKWFKLDENMNTLQEVNKGRKQVNIIQEFDIQLTIPFKSHIIQ
jgi:hypothetical protein